MSLLDPTELLAISLQCIEREFPYYLEHAVDQPMQFHRPAELHPSFFGCTDWHSAVHNHWLLIRLRREWPELEQIEAARMVLDRHLDPKTLAIELAYFDSPNNAAFSRPYGWAWVLQVHAEAVVAGDPEALRWAAALKPLRDELAARLRVYFSTALQFPIRTGLHGNSAFALTLGIDSARSIGDSELETSLVAASRRMFLHDRDYPSILEPSGGDFLSPALTEAGLMATVLETAEFTEWFDAFLPLLGQTESPVTLLEPPMYIRDASDPATVHLNGLLLTKVWSLCRIAQSLAADDPRIPAIHKSIQNHLDAAQDALDDRHYHATHWIPTFVVLAYSAVHAAGLDRLA